MNLKTLAPLKVFLLSIAVIAQFSCSKDSDLLTDYVLSETENTLNITQLVLDDTFIINSQASLTLDVLANDGFENTENVMITETSEPENGTVVINTDNTLTYTPSETAETTTTEETTVDTTDETTAEETVDTFTYTTEVVNEDATTTTAIANVTITSKNSKYTQVMFTDAQISLMINRVESGFSKPGTNGEDITMMVNEAKEFLTNPTVGRLDWMPSSNLSDCYRGCDPVPANSTDGSHEVSDNIFYAGIYAFILANRNDNGDLDYAKQLANAIATQILARANDSSLDFSNRNSWLDGVEANPFFITAAWLEKTLNNWSLIKSMDLVTNLTVEEETTIDNWFKKGADWAYDKLYNHYVEAFGPNWESSFSSTGYNKFYLNNSKSVVYVNGTEKSGYTLNFAAALIGWNTTSKYASLIHTYALLYQDQNALELSERWFEDTFKFSVFPDGTSYELVRASASTPKQGIQYWAITEGQLVSMAHTHAVAVLRGNPIVNGQSYSALYDYTTSEGLSDYLPSHVASDTKGGTKGLKNYLLAHAKYIGQSTGLNGWGEVRQVNQTPYPKHEMPDNFHYFVAIAQANSYYQNTELKSLYSGTNGYQVPKTNTESGAAVGAWKESYMSGFGKTLVAFPYLETEGLYNNGTP